MKYVLIGLLKVYRLVISPLYGNVCRYYPSCSAYALRAVQVHGAVRGSWLAARRVGSLVVAGAQTDACIRSTLHGALVRGYDALLVSDAHTTEDQSAYGAPPPDQVIAHTNLYWQYQQAPGRTAGTARTEEVRFVG